MSAAAQMTRAKKLCFTIFETFPRAEVKLSFASDGIATKRDWSAPARDSNDKSSAASNSTMGSTSPRSRRGFWLMGLFYHANVLQHLV